MSAASARDRLARLLLPGPRHHLLALLPFVVVFAIVPFSLYAHSGEDWGFPFAELLLIAGLGLALFLGCAVLIRLLASWYPDAASTIAVALFCLGLFLLLAQVYAPIQIGPLDGTEIESAEPVLYTVLELVFLAALVPVFVLLRRGRGLGIAASFSIALGLVALGYAGVLAWADREDPTVAEAAPGPALPAGGPVPGEGARDIEGNVYHIVLDRMQTDAFLHALEQTGRAPDFKGFELFRNNLSNYIATVPASASYFTGTLYKGGGFDAWSRTWRESEGLLAAASARGYRIWMYSALRGWENRHVDRYLLTVDVYEEESGFAGAGLYELLHIWLASLAPNPLTNEALPHAARLADSLFELTTGRLRPLSSIEGLHQVAGAMTLRRALREERLRAADGVYVYAHAQLPHGPHILDRDCRYVGPTGKRPQPITPKAGYLLQAECALDLVGGFLEELKRLDRYDASTIVIHGDTGDWMPLGETRGRRGRILDYPEASLLSYVQALLMIKRPGAQGPLGIREAPTQLVDLYPTLVDLLDLPAPPDGIDGRSIYATGEDGPREVLVAFDPEDLTNGRDFMEVRIEDPGDPPSSGLTVLGPADDPATWRRKN